MASAPPRRLLRRRGTGGLHQNNNSIAFLKLLPVLLWCFLLVMILESIQYDPQQTRALLFENLFEHYEKSSLASFSLLSFSKSATNRTIPNKPFLGKTAHLRSHGEWVVFYHIYIPPDDKNGSDVALSIIEEQIQQLGLSYAGQHYRPNFTTQVHYTTIGGSLNDTWMQVLCDDNYLRCSGRHFRSGHEMVTLDLIPGYCAQNTEQKVLYLHTKGSFHHDSTPGYGGQHRWRRHMTDATTSQLCVDALSRNDQNCNACGLLFSPFPSNHYTGNSWAASCSFLQHVRPSAKIIPIRSDLLEEFSNLRHHFFPQAPPYYGTGRYLGEHWLGTSPLLQPCDLSQQPNIGYWMTEDRNTSLEFVLKSSPRFAIDNPDWAWQAAVQDSSILDKPYRRMRDYFLLPGVLQRFVQEYDAVPPENWWGWSWYVDGARWKKRVKESDKNAVWAFLEGETSS